MNGYFIAEEGPLAGMVVVFEEEREGNEWSLGRDPEASDVPLEDPMVSRRHALVRLTPEGFIFENLSTVNPATQNGMVVDEPVLLKEGDIIQIGSTFFHFTGKAPAPAESPPEETSSILGPGQAPPLPSEGDEAGDAPMESELHFGPTPDTRWLLKVISGPNTGAEFAMHKGANYLLGKDPNICDVVFQDLSVSRQHARLSVDGEENAFVEDLGSRNGVIVNGELISDKQLLTSQDLVALGTTAFLVIDRREPRETILSPPTAMGAPVPGLPRGRAAKEKAKKDWKEMIIPKRHLAIAGTIGGFVFIGLFATLALFKSEPVQLVHVDKESEIRDALKMFPGVQFAFNAPSGKLFLTGDVLTAIKHQELLYKVKDIPYVTTIEDNVVIDELVSQSFNDLLSLNEAWVGVAMYAPEPGMFVLRGYLETNEEADKLADYTHRNFDYLSRLSNDVVVEQNLKLAIEQLLLEGGFYSVKFELSNGEAIMTGRLEQKEHSAFLGVVGDVKDLHGIRAVKDYVVAITDGSSSRMNLSEDYRVSGYSMGDGKEFFVVINGRILGKGDLLDGMMITQIDPKMVLLQKDGMQYKIDFSMQ